MIEPWSFVSCPILNIRQPAIRLPISLFSCWLVFAIVFLLPFAAFGQTEDIVVVQRSEREPIIKRRGTILEWKGNSLTLGTQQRERQIPNEEIVEIQTTWPANYQAALESLSAGKHLQAGTQLVEALKEETRPWAKRAIRAELARVLLALGQNEPAIDQFLIILLEDPQTQYFYLCPLKWIGTASIQDQKALALLKSPDSIEQMMGASWLIPGRETENATKVLDRLTHDLDPRVQKYAAAQLWRLRGMNLSSINDRQLEVWEQKINEMPAQFRAGPRYFLAEVQMKRKQFDLAKINWMRIPILHPDRYDLAAAALYQTSLLLDNDRSAEESSTLRSELKQKYGDTTWAKQLPAEPER
jgi:tetratricopeptide (TPR) repeat protein